MTCLGDLVTAKGVTVPLGTLQQSTDGNYLEFNEYIVYDVSR